MATRSHASGCGNRCRRPCILAPKDKRHTLPSTPPTGLRRTSDPTLVGGPCAASGPRPDWSCARRLSRAWLFSQSGRSLDPGTFAEDAVRADPAVDPATVVPNLEASSLDRLHQMQVLLAVHLAQHDVADLEGRRDHRLERTQLPGLDLAPPGVPPGPELNGFTVLEAGDIIGSPSHAVSFHESPQQGE